MQTNVIMADRNDSAEERGSCGYAIIQAANNNYTLGTCISGDTAYDIHTLVQKGEGQQGTNGNKGNWFVRQIGVYRLK